MARILVADDSADIRTLLVRILSRDGHLITEAVDGEEAFRLLLTERFDVAVLDVMMPRLDGLTLCRMLRDTPGLGPLGIVVVSAASSEIAALAAGADAFLSKPFLPSRLLAILGNLTVTNGTPAHTIAERAIRPRRRRSQAGRSLGRSRRQQPSEYESADDEAPSSALSQDAAR